MKNRPHNLIMSCQICGAEVGSTYSELSLDEFRAKNNIVDQRCSDCNLTHGTFRELLDEYKDKMKEDESKAEVFVAKNRKRADFDKELKKELDNKGDIITNK